MTVSLALGAIAMTLLWAGAVASPATRNRPFLVFLAAASIIAIGASRFGGLIGRAVEVGAFATAIVALLYPQGLRLSSWSRADDEADGLLRRLSDALDESAHPESVRGFLPSLDAPPFTTVGDPWWPVGRLFRLIVARHGETEAEAALLGRMAVRTYRRAGRAYWKVALDRRIIGRRHIPPAAVEDVLLRSFIEEFNRLIQPVMSSFDPVDASGPSADAVVRCIDVAERLELHYPSSFHNLRLLLDAMRAGFAVALGDRSEEALAADTEALAAISEGWQTPAVGS